MSKTVIVAAWRGFASRHRRPFGVGTLLQSLLVQTSARDPLTIASIALVMVAVSLAACFWPVRRATRLDPVSALRID